MTVTAHLLERDGTTVLSPIPDTAGFSISVDERSDGTGELKVLRSHPNLAGLRVVDRVIVLKDGATDLFAYLTGNVDRTNDNDDGGTVTIKGDGVRRLVDHGKVFPPADCQLGEEYRRRTLGAPDLAYDTSGLPTATSLGRWVDQPFPTPRPANYPDVTAHYIWSGTGPQDPGVCWAWSPTFQVAEDGIYGLLVSSDDENDVWMTGMVVGKSRGEFKWQGYDLYLVRLCAGVDNRIAARFGNLERPNASANVAWGICSLVPLAGDGKPQSANQIWAVATDAEGGTLDIDWLIDGIDPVTINPDDTATDVQTALEAELGAGNVSVSGAGTSAKAEWYYLSTTGTGGTRILTVEGQPTNPLAYNAAPATVKAEIEAALAAAGFTGDITVTVTGSYTVPDPLQIGFTGTDVTNQPISMTNNGGSITGGSDTYTNVQDGAPYDPWLIELIGAYANQPILIYVDGADLVGGSAEVDEIQHGDYADAIIHTDETWKVLAYPTAVVGLTPGRLLRLIIEEYQARGDSLLDDVTLGFTDTHDSNGVAWASQAEVTVLVERTSIKQVVKILERAGYDIWMAWETGTGLVLHAAQDRGTDRTATVTLDKPGKKSRWWQAGDQVSVLRSYDDQGAIVETSSATTSERYEEFYDAEGATPDMVAMLHLGELSRWDTPEESAALSLSRENQALPLLDGYDVADLVTAENLAGSGVTQRVSGFELEVDDKNDHETATVRLVVQ